MARCPHSFAPLRTSERSDCSRRKFCKDCGKFNKPSSVSVHFPSLALQASYPPPPPPSLSSPSSPSLLGSPCSAAEDVPKADEVRTLVKDIWDLRQAKLKKGVDQMISQQETFAKVRMLTKTTSQSKLLIIAMHVLLYNFEKLVAYCKIITGIG